MSKAIEILYCAADGDHITLHTDGTITIFQGLKEIKINYEQSQMLEKMIIAKHELTK